MVEPRKHIFPPHMIQARLVRLRDGWSCVGTAAAPAVRGHGSSPHACRDGGRCRHLDSPLRHSALEQDIVLPMLSACHPWFFNCLSPIHALKTGWYRSCSTTAHKKQHLLTTRRKAAAEGRIALEAIRRRLCRFC